VKGLLMFYRLLGLLTAIIIGVLIDRQEYGLAAGIFAFNVFDYLIDLREKS
jgi:hypothetical protein